MSNKNDKIKAALRAQRAKTTASMEFYSVFKQSGNTIKKAPKIGLWLAVDNTGLKLYLRKGKKSFAEEQCDNWLQKQGIKE